MLSACLDSQGYSCGVDEQSGTIAGKVLQVILKRKAIDYDAENHVLGPPRSPRTSWFRCSVFKSQKDTHGVG